MKKMILAGVLILGIAGTSLAAEPPKSMLQSNVPLYSETDECQVKLKEFVSPGLKPGKWEKISNDQWLYRISSSDVITGNKSKVTISFHNIKQKNIVVIDKIHDGRRYLGIGELANFQEMIIKSSPSYQVCSSKVEESRNAIAATKERLKKEEEENEIQIRATEESKRKAAEAEMAEKDRLETMNKLSGDYSLFGFHSLYDAKSTKREIFKKVSIRENNQQMTAAIITKIDGSPVCELSLNNLEIETEGKYLIIATSNEVEDCQIHIQSEIKNKSKRIILSSKGSCESKCDFSKIGSTDKGLRGKLMPTSFRKEMIDRDFELKEEQKSPIESNDWK